MEEGGEGERGVKKASELGDEAKKAVEEGGSSSHVNMTLMIQASRAVFEMIDSNYDEHNLDILHTYQLFFRLILPSIGCSMMCFF